MNQSITIGLAAGISSMVLSRNGKVSENPVQWPWPLWPMTLKLNRVLAVVLAKFHQAKCNSS